jgi:hypothetical protein
MYMIHLHLRSESIKKLKCLIFISNGQLQSILSGPYLNYIEIYIYDKAKKGQLLGKGS